MMKVAIQTFKPFGAYAKSKYLPYKTLDSSIDPQLEDWTLLHSQDNYFLLNSHCMSYCRIPRWIAQTLEGKEKITYFIGPFVFFNDFESTKEGRYLISIVPYYFKLSEKSEKKVKGILKAFDWWVRIHEDYVSLMRV